MRVLYVEGIRYKGKKLRSLEGLMSNCGIMYYHKVRDNGGEYWSYVSDFADMDYSSMEDLEELECTEVEVKLGGEWVEVWDDVLGLEGYSGDFVVVELEPNVVLGFQKSSVRLWYWSDGVKLVESSCASVESEDLCVVGVISVDEYKRVIECAYSTGAKIFDMRGLGLDVLGLIARKLKGEEVYWLVSDDVEIDGLVELAGIKLYGMSSESENEKGAVEVVIDLYEKERLKV